MLLQDLRGHKARHDDDLSVKAAMVLERVVDRLVEAGLPVQKVISGNGKIVFCGGDVLVVENFDLKDKSVTLVLHDAMLRMNDPRSAWSFSTTGACFVPVWGETLYAIRDAIDVVAWCEHHKVYPNDECRV